MIEVTDPLRDELQWLGTALSDVRDAEVLHVSRHGEGHVRLSNHVTHLANLDALRQLGAAGVLAVTVLTSLTAGAVGESWGRADVDLPAEVLRLAEVAALAGAHGVVCAGTEAALVRDRFGAGLATLVPGIRLAGGATHDRCASGPGLHR